MFFTIFVVFSIVFFLYFKVKFWRSNAPMEKKWIQTKANIALGVFLVSFGLNQIIYTGTWVAITVGIVFSLLGIANIVLGYRAYQHFLPLVIEESRQSK
ncbi:YtpI family protein [Anaerobacillus sp. MEB173]|uniref:YtpI family protein n=1 Tax=Anaerobacillus sp. MEB173 TaxID=3383345 RepID=UPI003F8EB8CB